MNVMKKGDYIHLAIFAVLLYLMSACSGDSALPEFEIEGEWNIAERRFECTDKAIEDDINYQINIQKGKKVQNRLIFSESAYEEIATNEDGSILFNLKGSYESKEGDKGVDVSLDNIREKWDFSLELFEPNLEHILAVRQPMTKDDIKKLYWYHFDTQGKSMGDDVTGVLVIKAVRISK